MSITGDRRVVPTPQWVLRCLVRAWATRRFFLANLGGFRSSIAGVGAWPSRTAVWPLGPFPPLPAACFGWFSVSVSCVSFFFIFFGSQSAFVLIQILWEYLLSNC
jgi:hypothetical protein